MSPATSTERCATRPGRVGRRYLLAVFGLAGMYAAGASSAFAGTAFVGPALAPRLWGALTAVLALMGLAGRLEPPSPDTGHIRSSPIPAPMLARLWGALALYCVLLPRLGFLVDTGLLVGATLVLLGWTPGRLGARMVVLQFCFVVAVYVVFRFLLQVQLPSPPWLLGGRL